MGCASLVRIVRIVVSAPVAVLILSIVAFQAILYEMERHFANEFWYVVRGLPVPSWLGALSVCAEAAIILYAQLVVFWVVAAFFLYLASQHEPPSSHEMLMAQLRAAWERSLGTWLSVAAIRALPPPAASAAAAMNRAAAVNRVVAVNRAAAVNSVAAAVNSVAQVA